MPGKVAIVDDEVDISSYLVAILEDAGYTAVAVGHTGAIVKRLLEEKPDLVILDIVMPGVSGLSLYSSLREHIAFSSVKLVIMSGMLASATQNEFADLTGDPAFVPPDAFISKPVNINDFLVMVRGLLGEQSSF